MRGDHLWDVGSEWHPRVVCAFFGDRGGVRKRKIFWLGGENIVRITHPAGGAPLGPGRERAEGKTLAKRGGRDRSGEANGVGSRQGPVAAGTPVCVAGFSARRGPRTPCVGRRLTHQLAVKSTTTNWDLDFSMSSAHSPSDSTNLTIVLPLVFSLCKTVFCGRSKDLLARWARCVVRSWLSGAG